MRDLNAALQLLAQRAEYITQAGGAAIALRRESGNEMICRARAGVTAPELGALLSTEFGLSGESVRTKKPLRCSDAERDSRVNREICRELGIASVMVMPVVNDDQVLGVFELFSGQANAFGDRDLATLERLSDLVAAAINLAHAAGVPDSLKIQIPLPSPNLKAAPAEPRPAPAIRSFREQKKVLWSAIDVPVSLEPGLVSSPRLIHDSDVPVALRNLRKCEACGFPVSDGRSLCVECEEKKWRGGLKSSQSSSRGREAKATISAPNNSDQAPAAVKKSLSVLHPVEISQSTVKEVAQSSVATFTLSAGIEPSQSWLSRYKYVIGTILAAAAAVAALAWR